ncbi:MAG: efflux RND transporter periplasmic adaptor subunit [Bacillota bacterium]
MMRRCAKPAAAILLSGAALLSSTGCERRGKQAMAMPARPPALVTTTSTITRDIPVYLEEIGKTLATEAVTIVPQVGGKIVATHVEHGAFVKKGDLLFEIDPRPFEAALASAQATLAQNKAELELARAEFNRVQSAAGTSAVSQLELDQKRSAVAITEAKIGAAEAAVQTAKLNLEFTRIYSPIDGRAGARLIDPGNVAKANDTMLLTIQRLDPIYAEFTVNENDLGTVRKYLAAQGLVSTDAIVRGLKVEVEVPGNSARVLSALGTAKPSTQPSTNPAGPREGQLTFLDNSVQSSTGTIRLRATIPNADHYFWPGQFVNVRLVLTIKKDAVLVPAQAQQIGQQGPFVYVIKPDSTAEIRPIVPGQRQGDLIAVDRGLQPGENVVVTGQMTVMPNAKVQVINAKPGNLPPAGGQPGAPKDATADAGR